MDLKLVRTNSANPDFIALVKLLDAHLAIMDGEEHAFYDQYNKIDKLKHVVVAYNAEKPVGCGAIKDFGQNVMEVKRMYTLPLARGTGVGTKVLLELEKWATELRYKQCILETGKQQTDAIKLYEKNGYSPIPNYGQYKNALNSICFTKKLG